MRIKLILVLAALQVYSYCIAQSSDFDKGGRVILSTLKVTENTSFHIYNPPLKAKAIYKDSIEAGNEYPEQLVSSLISASSQGWIDYNTFGGNSKSEKKDQKYFDFIKSMDIDKNYYELKSKLMFELNGQEYAIIKFYFHTELLPESKSGAYVMVKDNGRWKYTTTNFTSDLALMVMRFNGEKLQELLRGQNSGNEIVDRVISQITTDTGFIEFTSLYKEFANWYEQDNTEYLNYFIDKNAW